MSEKITKENILNGDKRSLAKAITLVESSRKEDQQKAQSLLEQLSPHTGKSIRIGLSGPPGVGKSTFIEGFGLMLIHQGKKVAVLTIDPSSPLHGGSLLGDKTRMIELSQNPGAFIRPSPSSGSLGGVAHQTRESLLLCEAAGYDIILIETVGVGQSEHEVHSMVDFFLVLLQPHSGDEIQGIKKGIIELAHAIAINKADGEFISLAQQTVSQYQNALHFIENKKFWQPQVLSCSALENRGFQEIWKIIEDFTKKSKKLNHFSQKRNAQNKQWFDKLIFEMLNREIQTSSHGQKIYDQQLKEILNNKTTPHQGAWKVIESLLKGNASSSKI